MTHYDIRPAIYDDLEILDDIFRGARAYMGKEHRMPAKLKVYFSHRTFRNRRMIRLTVSGLTINSHI